MVPPSPFWLNGNCTANNVKGYFHSRTQENRHNGRGILLLPSILVLEAIMGWRCTSYVLILYTPLLCFELQTMGARIIVEGHQQHLALADKVAFPYPGMWVHVVPAGHGHHEGDL